jgi:NAD+ synthase (glutamine-hydrolysing)
MWARAASASRPCASACAACGLPLVYAHLVGGQDEVVFEGAFVCAGADGHWPGARRVFEENCSSARTQPRPSRLQLTAMTGARAQHRRRPVGRAGAGRARLHRQERLSGRASWACRAASIRPWCWRWRWMRWARPGARVMMPSPYTADISWIDARDMAQRLGVRYDEISIVPQFEAFKARWRPSSPACPRTRPKRTSRPASAAPC